MNTNFDAAPSVGVTDAVMDNCVVGRLVVVNVIVYAVPIVPVRVRSVNATTPFTAVLVVVPPRVAPVLTDAVTWVTLSEVTVAPAASRSVTTGCVPSGPRFGPPTGAVVTTIDCAAW